jgi:hypothetical protein
MARSRGQTVVLVVAAMLAGALLLPIGAYAAQEVQAFITNDDAHSVPVHTVGTQTVTGSVAVSGGSVGVSGPVSVTGSVNAIPAGPTEPFVASADNVGPNAVVVTVLHVPVGKRAVLQYVSVGMSIAHGAMAEAWIQVTFNGVQTGFTFHTRKQTQDGKYFGQDDWTGDGPITLYADPNTDIKVTVQATISGSTWVSGSIAGYYADVGR